MRIDAMKRKKNVHEATQEEEEDKDEIFFVSVLDI